MTGAGTKGTILLTTGGRGTRWYRVGEEGNSINAMMDTLLDDGYKLVEIAWVEPGVWEEPGGTISLACRSATAFHWVHENIHQGGLLAAQGNSGGSAQIAFSLAYYGLDEILDLANLSGGPPPCPTSTEGRINFQQQQRCLAGAKGWDESKEPMLSGDPRLLYPNTIVRFFLGENEPTAYIIETARAYHAAITSEKSLQIVPNTGHGVPFTGEGTTALITSINPAFQPTPSTTTEQTAPAGTPPSFKVEEGTIRAYARDLDIDWGTVIRTYGPALNDDLYENSMGKQFNVLVPENGMYMVDMQRIRGVWNFARMDRVVELAEANDMKVRGHTLIWGDNPGNTGDWHPTPDWFRSATLTREEAIDVMDEHISAVISRYGSRVDEWVVVNEPIAWDGSGLMNNVWKNKIGADYVELAFQKADELAPDAILILNEFGADYLDENRFNTRGEIFYNYVRELVEKGVPIDAVGLEFHLSAPTESWQTEPTINKIVENFERYGELGLGVYVTELDIRIKEPITPEKLQRQAELYAMVIEAVLMSQYSRSITVWGHTGRYSWINDPGRFPGYSSASLFDENHEPKPAYYAVLEVLRKYLR